MTSPVPSRGQVYWVDFNPVKGSEQGGKRPAVVISNDVLNHHGSVVIVAPITSQHVDRTYPHEVYVAPGALDEGRILGGQIRTVAKERLGNHIADLTDDELAALDRALLTALGLPKPKG